MGRVVPEENSNSPRDNWTIINIVSVKNNKCRIYFLDNCELTINRNILNSFSLTVGSQLSSEEIEDIKNQSSFADAEQYIVSQLSNFLYPQNILKLKLLKKGYRKEVIDKIISKLTENGYINDLEFAKAWIFSRIKNHPEGKIKLLLSLKKRGISEEIAQSAIQEIITDEVEKDCIHKVIENLYRINGDYSYQDIYKKLFNSGFSSIKIKKYIKELDIKEKSNFNN